MYHLNTANFQNTINTPTNRLGLNDNKKSQSDTVTSEKITAEDDEESNEMSLRDSSRKFVKETREDLPHNEDEDPSLAPYGAHPLLYYLKNRNTIGENRIISFRYKDASTQRDVTTLILKPVARSVAGVNGKAISTPLSRAVLMEGTNVDILFEPEAFAIAGPGGTAHAQSDLEISYEKL